jgi:hypothetical protein
LFWKREFVTSIVPPVVIPLEQIEDASSMYTAPPLLAVFMIKSVSTEEVQLLRLHPIIVASGGVMYIAESGGIDAGDSEAFSTG